MIAITLIAILAAVAIPSFAGALDRGRLKAGAETLLADLNQARMNAAEKGQDHHWTVTAALAGRWCYTVSRKSGCGCGDEVAPVRSACQVHRIGGSQVPSVAMTEGRAAVLRPDGRATTGGATFTTARGERLRVDVGISGRGRICSREGSMKGYPAR